MTTTKGQPQPHIMHLHVNPKSQVPMTTTEGQPDNPTSCIYMYTQKTWSHTKAAAPI